MRSPAPGAARTWTRKLTLLDLFKQVIPDITKSVIESPRPIYDRRQLYSPHQLCSSTPVP